MSENNLHISEYQGSLLNQNPIRNRGFFEDIFKDPLGTLEDLFKKGIDAIEDSISSTFDHISEFLKNPVKYTTGVIFEYIKDVLSRTSKLITDTDELIKSITNISDLGDIVDVLSKTLEVLEQAAKLYLQIIDFIPDTASAKSSTLSSGNVSTRSNALNPNEVSASTRQLESLIDKIKQALPAVEVHLNQLRANEDIDAVTRISQRISHIGSSSSKLINSVQEIRAYIDNPGSTEIPSIEDDSSSNEDPVDNLPKVPNIRAEHIRINRRTRTLNFSYSVEAQEALKTREVRYNISFRDENGRKIQDLKEGRFTIRKTGKGTVRIPIDNYLGIEKIPYGTKRIRLKIDKGNNVVETNERDNVIFFKGVHRLISNSEGAQYLASNPDLIAAFGFNLRGVKKHYIEYGYREGRSLNNFNASQYLASHPGLINAFGNGQHSYETILSLATKHYIEYGYREGRSLNNFNASQYLASHPDLINAFGNGQHSYETALSLATKHYIEYGYREGRTLDSFNESWYLISHPDLVNAFGSDIGAATKHYIEYGYREGRTAA